MFPLRFFPNRMFAPRFWAKVGAVPIIGTSQLELNSRKRGNLEIGSGKRGNLEKNSSNRDDLELESIKR